MAQAECMHVFSGLLQNTILNCVGQNQTRAARDDEMKEQDFLDMTFECTALTESAATKTSQNIQKKEAALLGELFNVVQAWISD